MTRPNEAPELLSPAGNWECARAAVANGADAVYFGLPRFNARLRAGNFTEEDLPRLMEFLHRHGVRGHCAFNTLIFTDELADAERHVRLLDAAGVDAVLVQDLGLARLVKTVAPRLKLHASTQMTITSPEGLRFARGLGIELAVLARELSLRDIERFQNDDNPLPLEVFVHGALCVAYSGQCLTSESLGQRSANRGECAQACRMPYELIVDGLQRDLGEKRYLLSPRDLAAVDEIPRLIELGVRSFKIEGRLKTPEYVAAVTRVYRKALDAAISRLPSPISHLPSEDRYALEMTFSRGFFTGWLHGVDHQQLVGARFGKKRGPLVGKVLRPTPDGVELTELRVPLKPGDGVVFENPSDTDREQGGFLYAVRGRRIEFQRGKLDLTRIPKGTRVYKTSDPVLDRELRATFQGEIPVRKQCVLRLLASGAAGRPLKITVFDDSGHATLCVTSAMPLRSAHNRPLTRRALLERFEKLGGTPFEIGAFEVRIEGELILPLRELNRMRREMVAKLGETSPRPGSHPPIPIRSAPETRLDSLPIRSRCDLTRRDEPALSVLCRTRDQVRAALDANAARIYADFEDIRLLADIVAQVRRHGDSTEIFPATPRIQKPGEAGHFKLIARARPDGVLVRNLGSIECFAAEGLRMTGDFSLNVANPLTARFLVDAGLERLTMSYDLNVVQALDLLRAAAPEWFELTLHQHMPMFHMEHCVFAAFLSKGRSSLDCGRPCDRHAVKLRARVGMEHPLKADVGCRNTLFNAQAQTGARFFSALLTAGLRHFRVELLDESHGEAARIIGLYQDLLAGKRDGDTLWRELKARSQLGVTAGTLRGG